MRAFIIKSSRDELLEFWIYFCQKVKKLCKVGIYYIIYVYMIIE